MNPQKLAAYQKRLLALRAGLQNQISDQRGGPLSQAEAAAERFGKPEDPRAQMNTERDLAFALSDREAEEIVAIDAALNRVDAATFGVCIDCGVPIAPARLDASPQVTRCVPCQEKFEQPRRS